MNQNILGIHSPSSSPYPVREDILTKKKQKLKEVKRINFWDHTARKYRRIGLCDFSFSVFHYNMLSSPFWYGIPRIDVIEYGGSGDKTDPRRIWNEKPCLDFFRPSQRSVCLHLPRMSGFIWLFTTFSLPKTPLQFSPHEPHLQKDFYPQATGWAF